MALIKALLDYAERNPSTIRPQRHVTATLIIGKDGEFFAFVPKPEKSQYRVSSPTEKTHSNAIEPFLVVDKAPYVVGRRFILKRGEWVDDADRHNAHREGMLSLLEACSSAEAEAVKQFFKRYTTDEVIALARTWDVRGFLGDIETGIQLPEGLALLHDAPDVHRAWFDSLSFLGDKPGKCCVTGEEAPIARLHGRVAFKGGKLPLVSVNFDSAEYFGASQAENSPVSRQVAELYTRALGHLLRTSSVVFAGPKVHYAVWDDRDNKAVDSLLTFFSADKTAEDALDVFRRMWRGNGLANLSTLGVHCAEFRVNGQSTTGRLALQSYTKTTAVEVGAALNDFIETTGMDTHIQYRLVEALKYHAKDKSPQDFESLVRIVLFRAAPSLLMFHTALTNYLNWRPKDRNAYTRERVGRTALLRLGLKRIYNEDVTMTLNNEERNPSYLAGRMFAVMERIQYRALGEVGSSIRDRCFRDAATTPANVMLDLREGAVHHLKKLARTNAPAAAALDKRLTEIGALVTGYPLQTTPRDQAQFILGYDAQRQHDIEAARDGAAKKRAAEAAEKE